MTKGDLARQNFKSGYNCSQAVALAFQDKIGMDPDTIARLTIGFGGGMGRMREVCGTISGVTFVLSALYGDRPKSEVYAMVQQVATKYSTAFSGKNSFISPYSCPASVLLWEIISVGLFSA